MELGDSHPRFTIPVESARPKGAGRFECWAPKLKRRVTLFDPFHVRLLTFLESNPRVSAYCERPMYWGLGADQKLTDFWVRAGRREICWIVTSDRAAPTDELGPSENIAVRHIHAKNFASRTIWIDNWMRILPYIAANTRFVSEQLLADIEQATSNAPTLGAIERDFQPQDIVLIRTAVFMLLHRGRLKAEALHKQPLGPGIVLRRLPV
ncbi:hypothetical protein [Propionivibrio sp.]|uniref:hypothetical protein n=1 Tax=Propionivibrio sp. TaxID=2212460 RepID=UPI003BF43EAF